MLHAKKLPYYLWVEAMNIICRIHDRVTIRFRIKETLHELQKGRKPNVKYFHVFGSECYIVADIDQKRKMDPMSEKGTMREVTHLTKCQENPMKECSSDPQEGSCKDVIKVFKKYQT